MKRLVALVLASFLSTGAFAQNIIEGQTPINYPFVLGGVLKAANMNSTADQAITINSPTPTYRINSVFFANASTSMTTAAGGVYAAAAKGGTVIIPATTVYTTLTGAAQNSAGSAFAAGLNATNTNTSYNVGALFLSLTTAQGAAATADIYVYIVPLP